METAPFDRSELRRSYMTRNQRWVGQTVGVAILAAGLLATGCDARGGGEGNANSTVNLSSLPAAEAWVDGKAAGSTPLAVPLAPGRHELVFKQTGFAKHRQTLDVAAGAVASVDATLQPVDPMDPDALRLVAAAYGVTVEPFRAPEVHRGAASIGGVALLYPRNDVRKEGLAGYRIDVTPAYEGGGWLEFRKGKTSLHREPFEPDTLVNAASLPTSVRDALKSGDTVTWGVYFTDARKPITAQFEIVAKPAATKKLADLASDRRLALQPAVLRQQLEAEVLQNYRLYSEALVRLLDIRAADKDSTAPYGGIVSCLRRLDLEDTALFTEASSKAVGLASRHRTAGTAAGLPSKRLPVATPAPSVAPTPKGGATTPTAPAAPTPAPAPAPDDAPLAGPSPSAPPMIPPMPAAPGALPGAPSSGPGLTPPAPTLPVKGEPSAPPTGDAPLAPPADEPGLVPAEPTGPTEPVVPSEPTPPAKPSEPAPRSGTIPSAPPSAPPPPTPSGGPSPSVRPNGPIAPPPSAPVAPPSEPTPPVAPSEPIPPVEPNGPTPPVEPSEPTPTPDLGPAK